MTYVINKHVMGQYVIRQCIYMRSWVEKVNTSGAAVAATAAVLIRWSKDVIGWVSGAKRIDYTRRVGL